MKSPSYYRQQALRAKIGSGLTPPTEASTLLGELSLDLRKIADELEAVAYVSPKEFREWPGR
jgi:hypothetical protein